MIRTKSLFFLSLFYFFNLSIMHPLEGCLAQDDKVLRVIDLEQIFSKEQKDQLENLISDFYEKSKIELLIITTDSISDFKDITYYSDYMIGEFLKKSSNKDVILVAISKNLKQVSISTSKGNVTRKITNKKSSELIFENMIPFFKKNQYYNGIVSLLNELNKID